MKTFTKLVENEDNQLFILGKKLEEYNQKKTVLKSLLTRTNPDEEFDRLMKTLKNGDNDLLRFEWAYLKAERDVVKYKELIANTLKEYTAKQI